MQTSKNWHVGNTARYAGYWLSLITGAQNPNPNPKAYIPPRIPRSSRLTPHASRLTPHASRRTPHAARRTPHASRRTPHASHLTPVIQVPPGESFQGTLSLFTSWSGVAREGGHKLHAVSHSQLSLVGWGSNGLWEETGIGSNGERSVHYNSITIGKKIKVLLLK